MIIHSIYLKAIVAGIAPQDGGHAQLMRHFKGLGYFYNLAGRLRRTEINGRAYCCCPHVPRIADGTKHNLVVLIRVAQEFIVVDFYNERNFVCVFASY